MIRTWNAACATAKLIARQINQTVFIYGERPYLLLDPTPVRGPYRIQLEARRGYRLGVRPNGDFF